MKRIASLFVFMTLLVAMPVRAEVYLLMAEEDGCYWCAKWNEEIAHIYPKTAEGTRAPLKRYNVHRDDPNVDFARRVYFTPTFILVRDGVEMDRIEGYPGEDFFWGLLDMMFQQAQIIVDQSG